MKIYTKCGDQGVSSLAGGTRIRKSNPLLEAYGTIDELNSHIGLCLAEEENEQLQVIQHRLFAIAGMLATETNLWDKYWKIPEIEQYTTDLEQEIDKLSEEIEPLRNFILPQGNRLIALLHCCRTICRRAERIITDLVENEPAYSVILKYTNRLSDLLFIMARYEHKKHGIPEINWNTSR